MRLTLSGVVSKRLVPKNTGARCESQIDVVERRALAIVSGLWQRTVHATSIRRRARARPRAAPGPYFTGAGSAIPRRCNDPPVLPSGYKDVAMKFLFHPSAIRCTGGITRLLNLHRRPCGTARAFTGR